MLKQSFEKKFPISACVPQLAPKIINFKLEHLQQGAVFEWNGYLLFNMTSSIKAASHIKWTEEGMIEQKGAKEIATCQQKGVIKNHYPITIILFILF